MRILHVIAGAKEGGAESIMVDSVQALAEAGVDQFVVTRGHNLARLASFSDAGVPFTIASFDKVWRDPTKDAIRSAANEFKPDVIHYWMGRAGTFALRSYRARNLAWYGGYYK